MESLGWVSGHWFEMLQTASIVIGFFVTAHTIREDTKERKIQNLFAVTAAHRELWSNLYKYPHLARILSNAVNFDAAPPTMEEELFVHLLILHLRASFKARNAGMNFDGDAVAADIRQFFAHPIPRATWKKSRAFQDRDFVEFVESNLR